MSRFLTVLALAVAALVLMGPPAQSGEAKVLSDGELEGIYAGQSISVTIGDSLTGALLAGINDLVAQVSGAVVGPLGIAGISGSGDDPVGNGQTSGPVQGDDQATGTGLGLSLVDTAVQGLQSSDALQTTGALFGGENALIRSNVIANGGNAFRNARFTQLIQQVGTGTARAGAQFAGGAAGEAGGGVTQTLTLF
ncbi:MAG: hypothetical protein ACE5JS_05065 [Nitrospinota bacterium]